MGKERSQRPARGTGSIKPRGVVVAQLVDAEELARRRVAEAIHDEALQDLLSAKQDLEDAQPSGSEPVRRAHASLVRAIRKLREAVFELHPSVVEHAGLEAALNAVAARSARQGSFRCSVHVDKNAVGEHDQLVLSLSRELLSNVAKHAGARQASVRVARLRNEIVLEVSDDGSGFDPDDVRDIVRQGHIGLVASADRVEAIGGALEVTSRPGTGTRVRALIPVDGDRDTG